MQIYADYMLNTGIQIFPNFVMGKRTYFILCFDDHENINSNEYWMKFIHFVQFTYSKNLNYLC